MAIYAVAIMPIVNHLGATNPAVTRCWYADDAGAVGRINHIREYWDAVNAGYHRNACKTVLLTKPQHLADATAAFAGTGAKVTAEGFSYLGSGIGSTTFRSNYALRLGNVWKSTLSTLCDEISPRGQCA